MSIEINDWRGNAMRVGVTVVWINRTGDNLHEGVITEIGERGHRYYSYNLSTHQYETQTFMKIKPTNGGRTRFITRVDRITVVS